MKKFKSILWAFALALPMMFVSCDKDDDNDNDDFSSDDVELTYTGTLTVTKSGVEPLVFKDKIFMVELDKEDKTLDLTMLRVKFAEMMPEQTMEWSDMKYISALGAIAVLANGVVPTIDDVPYDRYTSGALNVTITDNNSKIAVTCACAGYTIVYAGVK